MRAVISARTDAICCCRLSACCLRSASSTFFSESACSVRPFQRSVTMTCVSAHTVTSAATATIPNIKYELPSISKTPFRKYTAFLPSKDTISLQKLLLLEIIIVFLRH